MWKFDGECQFGFAYCDRLFQPLSLFEVPIGLAGRYGAGMGQLFDRIGELIDTPQQVARAIEALGLRRNRFKAPDALITSLFEPG